MKGIVVLLKIWFGTERGRAYAAGILHGVGGVLSLALACQGCMREPSPVTAAAEDTSSEGGEEGSESSANGAESSTSTTHQGGSGDAEGGSAGTTGAAEAATGGGSEGSSGADSGSTGEPDAWGPCTADEDCPSGACVGGPEAPSICAPACAVGDGFACDGAPASAQCRDAADGELDGFGLCLIDCPCTPGMECIEGPAGLFACAWGM